jgi:hypothetical protein
MQNFSLTDKCTGSLKKTNKKYIPLYAPVQKPVFRKNNFLQKKSFEKLSQSKFCLDQINLFLTHFWHHVIPSENIHASTHVFTKFTLTLHISKNELQYDEGEGDKILKNVKYGLQSSKKRRRKR